MDTYFDFTKEDPHTTIKHLHSGIDNINGNLYFEVDDKLMVMFVSTPEFNNSGEWNIYEFKILNESSENHKMLDLKPYNIADISLSEKEFKFLKKISDKPNYEKYPEYEGKLLRMKIIDNEINIIIKDNLIPLSEWKNKKKLKKNYGLYNILIPILEECINNV